MKFDSGSLNCGHPCSYSVEGHGSRCRTRAGSSGSDSDFGCCPVAGLRGFKRNRSLDRSASHKASDILRCDVFSHDACGRPFTFWIEKKYAKRQCWSAGENIAWGTKPVGGVRDIFKAWMHSPGHRNAILSRRYTDIGIGFRVGAFRGRQSTRVWVQHFGQIR